MKAILLLTGAVLIAGCRPAERPVAAQPPPIRFENVALRAGIDFSLGHGDKSPLTILETAGGGAAFFDYNRDEYPDALLVGPHRVALFVNRAGRFEAVPRNAGLSSSGYWMGCATADFDGDGWGDVLLVGYDRVALYRNDRGRFQDVTRAANISDRGWSVGAAFGDYDRDGRLDLYVSRYVRFDRSTPQLCQLGNIRSACGPEVYDPQHGSLYRNLGSGKFEDVTRGAGVDGAHGKTWGALFSDFNEDGYPELYLANDMLACDFFRNVGGRYTSKGPQGAAAYDGSGHLQGAMGVDSGDYDNDGRLDLFVANYFAQQDSLYRNEGDFAFTETGASAGIGLPTARYVGFGTGFVDFDNDGWLDVLTANGHVRDDVAQHDPGQSYRQKMQVFRNVDGRYQEVTASAGAPFSTPIVGRGASFADYDGDGRVDALVCDLEGKAQLLRNISAGQNHWLTVRLKGRGGNTQGLGALVRLTAGGRTQLREIKTCGSVSSGLYPAAHFGLGSATQVDRLEVRWQDGTTSTPRVEGVGRTLLISR